MEAMEASEEPMPTCSAETQPPQQDAQQPADDAEQQDDQTRLWSLPGLEGEWTLEQLVEMEMQKDPRLSQVRRSALPPEFWDARRRARNHARLQRNYGRRKRRGDALREEEEARLAGMSPQQAAQHEAARLAEREAAKAAAAEQRERVAAAMAGAGLRVVVDCALSLAPGTADREVRSLCKQLELCAAANKRAPRPVSLQFASFAGPVRAFALEGMHADRWPAAAGHEAPLAQLFPGPDLVVLSPDADEALQELEEGKVYVIGGLVDRTVQKGASLRLAQQCGARAVRLPIPEHLGGALHKGKGVLNVNDVFAILLSVHAGQGWKEALEAAIPQRFRQPQQGKQQGKKGQRQAAAVEEEQQRGGSAEAATAAAAEEHAEEQQQAAAAGGTAAPAEKARLF